MTVMHIRIKDRAFLPVIFTERRVFFHENREMVCPDHDVKRINKRAETAALENRAGADEDDALVF
jgi:hypothetical protein